VFYVQLHQLTGNRPLRQHGEIPHFVGFATGANAHPVLAAPIKH
jgi:multidrug efflux pump